MWVEAKKNGKFTPRERYLDPLTGKTKIVSVTIEKDTPRARKAAQEQRGFLSVKKKAPGKGA